MTTDGCTLGSASFTLYKPGICFLLIGGGVEDSCKYLYCLPQSQKVPAGGTVESTLCKSAYLTTAIVGETPRQEDIHLPKATSVRSCVVEIHPRKSGSIRTPCSNFDTIVSVVQHCLSRDGKFQNSIGRILLKRRFLLFFADYFCLILT